MEDYTKTYKEAYVSAITDIEELYDDETGGLYDGETYVLIEKVYVPKDLRGQGIAKKLLTQVIDEVTADGLGLKLCAEPLEDDIDTERLVALYDSVGFCLDEETTGSKIFMTLNM